MSLAILFGAIAALLAFHWNGHERVWLLPWSAAWILVVRPRVMAYHVVPASFLLATAFLFQSTTYELLTGITLIGLQIELVARSIKYEPDVNWLTHAITFTLAWLPSYIGGAHAFMRHWG